MAGGREATPDARRATARRGERLAALLLIAKGYRVVARNWRCASGEIDLVCRDGATLVFVEVKARRSGAAGDPEDAVDARKRARLVRLAQAYLAQHRLDDVPCRFDVVAVDRIAGIPRLRHLRAAFRADGDG